MRLTRPVLLAVPTLVAALATVPPSSAHVSSAHAARPTVVAVSPTVGSTEGRQQVTIRGTGFAHGSRVYFGSRKAAGVHVLNPRTIVAYAPAQVHATRDVTVRTIVGTSRHVAADRYTYRHGYVPRTRLIPHGAPLPSDADGVHDADDEYLGNWSCGSVTHCVAVGSYEAANRRSRAMALVHDAHGTSAVRIPGAVQTLVDVSCVGSQFCGATGLTPDYAPVFAILTDGHWAVRHLPRATGSGTLSSDASLSAVSCAAPGHCVFGAATYHRAYIYVLSGSSLSVRPAPLPGSVHNTVEMEATSCATPTWCVLTGSYGDKSYGAHTAAIMFADGTPHSTELFGPHHIRYPGIGALECPAVARCYGAGYYALNASTTIHSEFAVLDAGGWHALPVPDPADLESDGSLLNDISCPAVARCVGVGYYYSNVRSGLPENGLIVRLHGSTVTARNAPVPTSGSLRDSIELDAVSCHSMTSCVAVGGVGNGALSETLTSAGVWVPDRLGKQPGATKDAQASYRSVVCPSAATCLVSGNTDYHFVESEAESRRALYSIAVKR